LDGKPLRCYLTGQSGKVNPFDPRGAPAAAVGPKNVRDGLFGTKSAEFGGKVPAFSVTLGGSERTVKPKREPRGDKVKSDACYAFQKGECSRGDACK